MRHFWCHVDAETHKIVDNRFQVAQLIACQPDEPRYIGDQDVFLLQEKVIEHILRSETEVGAKAAASMRPDPIQQTLAEELKNVLRRGTVDREKAKTAIRFLGQPAGPFVIKTMRAAFKAWTDNPDDSALLGGIMNLEADFAKGLSTTSPASTLRREDLKLVCFEYISG